MKRIEDLTDGQLCFAVILVARASRTEVVGWSEGGHLKVRVTAPPVDEAANRQLVKLLARTLDCQKVDVKIASGSHSRTKRLVVPRACKNRLLSFADIC
ncbi:MAG: DUF167 domain-containing protein [Candidatus Krumholzibacteria bacterium]|nr:DUF167 domain-containing protein [Candidatus Krumholzibacteria bacterium]